MSEAGPGELKPDETAEDQADARVRETIAQEREAERPADERMLRTEEASIERAEDEAGLNGIIGRIRAALRRR